MLGQLQSHRVLKSQLKSSLDPNVNVKTCNAKLKINISKICHVFFLRHTLNLSKIIIILTLRILDILITFFKQFSRSNG